MTALYPRRKRRGFSACSAPDNGQKRPVLPMTVKLTERRRGALAALYVATEYNSKRVRSAELYDTAATVAGVELLRSQMDASAILAEMKGEYVYSHETMKRGNEYSLRQEGLKAIVDMELPGDLTPADLGGPVFPNQ